MADVSDGSFVNSRLAYLVVPIGCVFAIDLSQQKSLAPCDGCSRGRVVALALMKVLWRKATIGSHSSRQCDHFVGAAPAAICHKQTPLPLIFRVTRTHGRRLVGKFGLR